MGTHHKKKKATSDHRIVINDIKRQQDADALRTALQPTFEGTTYTVPLVQTISYVNVSESSTVA